MCPGARRGGRGDQRLLAAGHRRHSGTWTRRRPPRRPPVRKGHHHVQTRTPLSPSDTPLDATSARCGDSNEDAAYASERLLAVADGGQGPGGAEASAAAIDALKPLELSDAPAAELLTMLAEAVAEADRTVRKLADDDHQPITTLTAMLWSGSQAALVHIGDSRAYLLRGGELSQLTQDHTYVQSLVDQGKLSPDEAASHPQRALLVRALGAGAGRSRPTWRSAPPWSAIATCFAPTGCPPSSTVVPSTRH